MVESAEDRQAHDLHPTFGSVDFPAIRCVLAEREMGAGLVVVDAVGAKLPPCPLRGGMLGDVDVADAAAAVIQDNEAVEDSEGDGGDGEEVDSGRCTEGGWNPPRYSHAINTERVRNRGRAPAKSPTSMVVPLLSIIRVAPLRGGHDGEAGNGCARQDPTARAGCKARRQEAVIDLPRHRKAVVAPREEVDAGEVALGADGAGRVDVAFRGGYDSVSVGVDEGDRRFVALQEPPGEVMLVRLKRRQPLERVEERLAGDPAGDEALSELPLRVVLGVEEIGVPRAVGFVAEGHRLLAAAVVVARLVAGDDR